MELVLGDIADPDLMRTVIDRGDVSVFHLASMVSAECELDFDRALRVNIDGAHAVLEGCRATGAAPRLVFASSIAAFGGLEATDVAGDDRKLTPETTYGTTKAVCELLVNEYTRKGFVDGRSARLPTVVIRPGKPNGAASSWVSGILREPMNGVESVLPVDPGTRVPLSGYRTIVDNLVRLHEVDGAALGPDRALNLPALNVTAQEMIDERSGGRAIDRSARYSSGPTRRSRRSIAGGRNARRSNERPRSVSRRTRAWRRSFGPTRPTSSNLAPSARREGGPGRCRGDRRSGRGHLTRSTHGPALGAGEQLEEVAERVLPRGRLRDREVVLDLIAIATADLRLVEVAGGGEVADDAGHAPLGDAERHREVANRISGSAARQSSAWP